MPHSCQSSSICACYSQPRNSAQLRIWSHVRSNRARISTLMRFLFITSSPSNGHLPNISNDDICPFFLSIILSGHSGTMLRRASPSHFIPISPSSRLHSFPREGGGVLWRSSTPISQPPSHTPLGTHSTIAWPAGALPLLEGSRNVWASQFSHRASRSMQLLLKSINFFIAIQCHFPRLVPLLAHCQS